MINLYLNTQNIYWSKLFCRIIIVLTLMTFTPVFAQFLIEAGNSFEIKGNKILDGETKITSSSEVALGLEMSFTNAESFFLFLRFGMGSYNIVWEDEVKFSSRAYPLHAGISYYPYTAKKFLSPYIALAAGCTFIDGDVVESPFSVLGRAGFILSLISVKNLSHRFQPLLDFSFNYRYDAMKSETGQTFIPQIMVGVHLRRR
ncbi:MAG: hypothetical protein GXO77_04690 [Calditrichaeota bacterium]|nr:hypothetical protein [Calditrichota bacterium]